MTAITDTRYSYIGENLKLEVTSDYNTERDFENNIGDITTVILVDIKTGIEINITDRRIFWDSLGDEIVDVAKHGCEDNVVYYEESGEDYER